jgi:hypothetical protein
MLDQMVRDYSRISARQIRRRPDHRRPPYGGRGLPDGRRDAHSWSNKALAASAKPTSTAVPETAPTP